DFMRHLQPSEITGLPRILLMIIMGGNSAQTNNNAGVLDTPIGKQQLGAYSANVGAQSPAYQRFEPSAIAHRDVVIKEDEHLRLTRARGLVAKSRKIKGSRPLENVDLQMPLEIT